MTTEGGNFLFSTASRQEIHKAAWLTAKKLSYRG